VNLSRATGPQVAFAIVVASLFSTSAAGQTLFGPTPYLGFGQSPFNGVVFTYFHLENCEDGLFNTPGASLNGGSPQLSGLSDSVDEDDGVINGVGKTYSLVATAGVKTRMRFTFSKAVLGKLPSHVGFVWTDVGGSSAPQGFGFGHVKYRAWDGNGVAVANIAPTLVGDGFVTGETSEDRFFGVSYKPGISKLVVKMTDSTNWEIDHVQYGRKAPPPPRGGSRVPEPGGCATALALLGAGLAAYGRRMGSRR
jgi:hypothetical protein